MVGHYETTCGGCDTIDTIDNVYKYIHKALDQGCDIVYEGLVCQSDTNRCIALKDKDLHVIFLDVHIDICLDAVQSRRSERGDDREFSPKNTIVKSTSFPAQKRKFTAAGVKYYEMTRDEALYFSMQKLGWPVGDPPVRKPELNLMESLDPATVPEWLSNLLPLMNQGTVVERSNILKRLKSCLLVRKEYDESKIRPIVQALDGQTLLEGATAMAWMARRLTMRAAFLDDTVLAARTIWADWGRAKEIDRISNLILDEMEVQSFV
jgi:hypothetical protein